MTQRWCPHLLLDDGDGGVGHTQDHRGPVLFASGGQQALDGPVNDVHTWARTWAVIDGSGTAGKHG